VQRKKIRSVAFYLPQFHPIPENDNFWGKGFTEWTNVTKAKPLFEGHYQPHLPADLGFYDLRLKETRLAQEQLARQYGIDAFCYYHYWFNGKRVLNTPIDLKMQNKDESLPFMFCWANENWTRRWDGMDKEVLIEQSYSLEDDEKHMEVLVPYLCDSRYLEFENKKVIAIYRSNELPHIIDTLKTWRKVAEKYNIQLYICKIDSLGNTGKDKLENGFDAAIEFQPFSNSLNLFRKYYFKKEIQNDIILRILLRIFRHSKKENLAQKILDKKYRSILNNIDYFDYVDYLVKEKNELEKEYKLFPCVTPFWDNTARRGKDSFRFINPSPQKFGEWVNSVVGMLKKSDENESLLFVNAWNEWAEGNHLEPCQKFGHSYLEEFKNAFR
jgi:lipopolysaccharide biosynthesis protein